MWNNDLLFMLAMLAKLIIREGDLGDVVGIGEVHDAGFAQVAQSSVSSYLGVFSKHTLLKY